MKKSKDWLKAKTIKIDVSGKTYKEAVELAKDMLYFFLELFENRDKNFFNYFIKTKFEYENAREHLWLTPIDYKDNVFTALVDNNPNHLPNIKYKDKLLINKDEVEDWIISCAGERGLIGDFINKSLGIKPQNSH
jgi:uncharacterized protein YegJ (DUF2314 family)